MESELFKYIGIDPAYIIIGMLVAIILLFILYIVNIAKYSKLKKRYNLFMQGKDAKSLEETLKNKFDNVDKVIDDVKRNSVNLEIISEKLKDTFQKSGIVKYDAFSEMGGKLSYSIALLDQKDNGFIVNAMHSREGCYTYIKEILNGESYLVLSEEEKEALNIALKKQNKKLAE